MTPLVAEVNAVAKPTREHVVKFEEHSELLLAESDKVTNLYESSVADIA